MYRLILSILFLLTTCSPSYALFWRAFASLTGDVAGSVDHAECDDLGTGLDDGMGFVVTSSSDVYFYYFDRSATDATSSPDYIRCKDAAFTSGVWILASTGGGGSGTVDTSGTPVDNDWARFTDADTIEGRSDSEIKADLDLEVGTDIYPETDVVPQAEAEAGTATTERIWTAQRVSQAIAALATGTGDVSAAAAFGTDNVIVKSDGTAKGVQATGISVDDNDVINPTASPHYAAYDTDGAGADLADKLVCDIKFNFTTTTEDAEYGDFWIECVINGTHTEIIRFDASDNQWELSKNMISTANMAGGIEVEIYTSGPQDLDTNDPDVCQKAYIMSSSSDQNVEFDLQADGRCGATAGSARRFDFLNNETDNYDMIIDPNGTDNVQIAGSSTSCGAGNPIYCGDDRSWVILYGLGETNWWALVMAGTCACTTQQ